MDNFEPFNLSCLTGWITAEYPAMPGNAQAELEFPLSDEIPLSRQVLIYRKMVHDLRQFVLLDSLTNLPSWMVFKQRFAGVLEGSRQTNSRFAVLFLDIDRFRNLTHAYGHEAGDELLRLFAQRIQMVLEPEAILSRKGGDRFFLLLPGVGSEQEAGETATRLMTALREPFYTDGQEVFLFVSIGIAFFPEGGTDAVTLLKNADAAMNGAKEAGRNTFRFYCDELNLRARRSLQLENLLYKSLEREEFSLCYQPQYRLVAGSAGRTSGRMIGCEALLRWRPRGMGLVSPEEFIPIAEATGMIEGIGEWVLRTACLQNRRWQDAGFDPCKIAVNLSPRQFFTPNLEEVVCRALQEAGLDPCWLELEITESLLMRNIQEAIAKLNRLRDLGVKVAIDDFGTGYSSLSYLKKLPIDYLKIDRTFVQDIERCPDNTAIVQAIICMAAQLKLGVIAEGVETGQQAAFLARSGCTDLQGFYFSPPLDARQFREFLTAHGTVHLGAPATIRCTYL